MGENNELELGLVFNVYGISIDEGVVRDLIIPETDHVLYPDWMPAELLAVVDTLLPLEFHFVVLNDQDENGCWTILGYHELVTSADHRSGLIEGTDEAIRLFLKREQELDEYLGLGSEG